MLRKIAPIVSGLIVAAICLMIGSVVYAQDGTAVTESNSLQRLTEMAFQVLTPVITLFAMWAAHRLIKVFEAKTGLDIPDKQEARIDDWIEQGIHWAEEKSRAAVQRKEAKLSGPEKLESAADFVLDLIDAKGWVGWTRDQIKAKTEAALGIHRANGGKPSLDEGE